MSFCSEQLLDAEAMLATTRVLLCLQCPDAGKKCAKCKVATYCSKACQRQDWKIGGHKSDCDKLQKELRAGTGFSVENNINRLLSAKMIDTIAFPYLPIFRREMEAKRVVISMMYQDSQALHSAVLLHATGIGNARVHPSPTLQSHSIDKMPIAMRSGSGVAADLAADECLVLITTKLPKEGTMMTWAASRVRVSEHSSNG